MLVNISDLEKGDEILVNSQGGFRRYCILETPRIGKRLCWKTKLPMYIDVKVSTHIETTYRPSWQWANGVRVTVQVPIKQYIVKETIEHNTIIKVDLNYKDMWLIKKHYNI
jgi:hypothetical protein